MVAEPGNRNRRLQPDTAQCGLLLMELCTLSPLAHRPSPRKDCTVAKRMGIGLLSARTKVLCTNLTLIPCALVVTIRTSSYSGDPISELPASRGPSGAALMPDKHGRRCMKSAISTGKP